MTVNEKKRPADEQLLGHITSPSSPSAENAHPCFWSVLNGESLDFVYVSASLHSFLGSDQASMIINQSLFDYIHPEEAARARRDLVDMFVSKSLLGSSISANTSGLNSSIRFGMGAICDRDNTDCEYLIANICLYLVSSRLSILVCHYENSPDLGFPERRIVAAYKPK
ncbi:hypothetical protein GGI15_001608 [Coemansia interrupta]|uniref:PAS domain-containing protein n=1 Tax=Coemansia interrupta TaxID=1126814 RepID=A0A9W8HQW4_9FUNG|nr:hypothetical protein GGI15_001608 [Coemansia interrupta]